MTKAEFESAALQGELDALHALCSEVLEVWNKLRAKALLDPDIALADLDVMRRLQLATTRSAQRRSARRSITPPGAHGPTQAV